MFSVTNPYQLALLIKKSLHNVMGTQLNACEATVQYHSIQIFISPLSLLYLQKVLFVHIKKCVFYIIYEMKFSLHISFKKSKFMSQIHNNYTQ